MITNQIGQVVSRHDYLPFGEEVTASVGGRANVQGYQTSDGVRKQFTGYERDAESGLDYAQARYFSSKHGRFTSVDPLAASASIKNPQTFNRYTYGLNSPYKFTDPLGLSPCGVGTSQTGVGRTCTQADDLTQEEFNRGLARYIFDRASQGYLDDTGNMAITMFTAIIEKPLATLSNLTSFISDGRDASQNNALRYFSFLNPSIAGIFQAAVLKIEWHIGRRVQFREMFRPEWYQKQLRDEYMQKLNAYNNS